MNVLDLEVSQMSDIAFGGIWRPESGAQWVRWGMSGGEYKAQDTTYFAQGRRRTDRALIPERRHR
jgi:hypothetical protein